MEGEKIIIIDKTLTVLWERYNERFINNISLIRELASLLYKLGSSYIEITPEIYNNIHPLPNDIEFIVNVNKHINIPSGDSVENYIRKNKDFSKESKIRISGLCDLMFFDYKEKLLKIKDFFGKDTELEFDDYYGLGTALSLEWLLLGGTTIVTTFSGIGRYTALEEILCALKFIENNKIDCDTKILPQILRVFESITNEDIPNNKSIIGKKIFEVESGIHVDGISKDSKCYEPFSPIEVGMERKIIIGKHSGRKSIELKLKELNINLEVTKFKIVLDKLRSESIKRSRELKDQEIYDICKGIGVI